jgi:subtilisin-like proprotein convertase family protein
MLLLASMPALAAAEVAVVRGAEWVSPPSMPDVKTVDMRRLPPAPEWKPGDPIRSIPRLFFGDPNAPVPVPRNPVFGHDALVDHQVNFRAPVPAAFGTPTFNQNVISSTAQPNDPTGDIGTHQFVAAINGSSGSDFAVYDKVTGAIVVPRTTIQSLGSGGLCAAGRGDPIVLFDELASRWLLTEFTSSGNGLCVYISDVADLSGSVTWTRYLFTLPNFPDYPKYGVWPNAYFVGANEGSASSTVRPFYAMDRQKMLAGLPATLQRLTIPNLAGFGFQMTQPADLAGSNAPDADAPGLFMRHRDDEAHNPGSNNPNADFIELYEFAVDWTTPANSAITGPITFQISEFSSNLNGLSAFEAFPQPNGVRLDPLRETVMHRLTYRRLPEYEVLVGNFVTDLFLGAGSIYPNDTGAVRWFELRRPTGPQDGVFANGFEGGGAQPDGSVGQWTLHQEGTFAPEDTIGTPAEQGDRWMAASSVDQDGNIALAYNMVRQAPAISAGLRYTGRLANDPLGVMTAAENLIIDASGSVGGVRWGDYNDMGIDPVDGCSFWFIGNYVNGGARANRAASFKFEECGGASFTLTSPAPSASVCANSASPTDADPITLNAASVNGFAGAVALSFPSPFATGLGGDFTPAAIASLPGSSVAQLTATNAAAPGTSTIIARGTSGAIIRDVQLSLTVATDNPAAPTLVAPANNASGIGATPTFTWTAAAQAASYLVEASTSNTFATTLFSQTVTGTSLVSPVALPRDTEIFWRVRPSNICGDGDNSSVFSFTTSNVQEFCRNGLNVAIPDNNLTGVSDNLTIAGVSGNVGDLDVRVELTHTYVGDLRVRLARATPAATVNLMTNPTNNPSGACSGDDLNALFDDDLVPARPAQSACASGAVPTYSGTVTPQQATSAFDGQSPNSTWTLTIIDSAGIDTGTLTRWCIILN